MIDSLFRPSIVCLQGGVTIPLPSRHGIAVAIAAINVEHLPEILTTSWADSTASGTGADAEPFDDDDDDYEPAPAELQSKRHRTTGGRKRGRKPRAVAAHTFEELVAQYVTQLPGLLESSRNENDLEIYRLFERFQFPNEALLGGAGFQVPSL
jgi:hypothetical protein